MSCGHDNFTNDCVSSTLQSVAEAQERIEEDCRSGCRQAIEELNGQIRNRGFDTIPVLLTCGCNPFSAAGCIRSRQEDRLFKVVKSFLFRVSEVSSETGCATLELLKVIPDHTSFEDFDGTLESNQAQSTSQCESEFDEFLADELQRAKKIVRTGICVTVDLKAFTSVTCLPPIHTV
ncbi:MULTISPECIES: CotY/CotZ family spore coat protein [Bacillus]|uniref:CotY/CotZ family spore coat protein n=1 Tax=Bacillus TaxID=1386 RepID=UPI0002E7ABBF|nr:MULTISPECIES: CotY/CotZ family spore coat protein [Bacillus]